MAIPASKVLEQALELTPAERLELARELITSVEPEQSPEWATAWKSELAKGLGDRFLDEVAAVRAQIAALPERQQH